MYTVFQQESHAIAGRTPDAFWHHEKADKGQHTP